MIEKINVMPDKISAYSKRITENIKEKICKIASKIYNCVLIILHHISLIFHDIKDAIKLINQKIDMIIFGSKNRITEGPELEIVHLFSIPDSPKVPEDVDNLSVDSLSNDEDILISDVYGEDVESAYAEHLEILDAFHSFMTYDLTSELYYSKDPLGPALEQKMIEMLEKEHDENIYNLLARYRPTPVRSKSRLRIPAFLKRKSSKSKNLQDDEASTPAIPKASMSASSSVDVDVNMLKTPKNDEQQAAPSPVSPKNPKFGRKHFTAEDYLAVDKATFHLIQDFMPKLALLLNSGALDPIAQQLEDTFHFDYYEAILAEIFSRSIAYNTNLDGEKIKIPVKNADGVYVLAEFTIRLYWLGNSLPSYVLTCDEVDEDNRELYRPWLVVRGTETCQLKTKDGNPIRVGGLESVVADFIDKNGVAEGIIESALDKRRMIEQSGEEQESLRELFEGRQFNLCGHSLGGNLVNQLAVSLYDNVHVAYAFSAPAVSKSKKKAWKSVQTNEEGQAVCGDNRKLINFQVQGDVVPSAGRRPIGTQIAVTPSNRAKTAGFIEAHLLMFLTKPFKMQLISQEDKKQIGRRAVETARVCAGSVFLRICRFRKDWVMPEWYQFKENVIDLTQAIHAQ